MIQNGVEDTLVLDAKRRLSSAPELLQRHSLRMAALADALADRENLNVDRAGLFCACVFHDLGLLVAGTAPFPVRSAGLLEAFLTERDVAAARVHTLVTAVRRHLMPPVSLPTRGTPPAEVALLRRVAWLDAVAVGDAEARRWRRELRTADADPLLDLHLGAVLGMACAQDLASGARAVAARVLAT
ncbi:MAG: HD domain-containing protein [Dermatophilaceae bacterium]